MVVINLSNKAAYFFIVLGILVLIVFGVNAYGTNNPSVMGHSPGELNLTPITINQVNNRVGINNVAPLTTLDVGGTFRSTSGTFANGLVVQGTAPSLRVTSLLNCDTIDTNGFGEFSCGIDASGGGGLTGTGTLNYLPKFTGVSSVASSQIYDSGTNLGIGTSSPGAKLDVIGEVRARWSLIVSNGTWDSYIRANPALEFSSYDDTVNIWRGTGFGRLNLGSIQTIAGSGTNPYDTGEILLGGPIKPSAAGGDVIIQLG